MKNVPRLVVNLSLKNVNVDTSIILSVETPMKFAHVPRSALKRSNVVTSVLERVENVTLNVFTLHVSTTYKLTGSVVTLHHYLATVLQISARNPVISQSVHIIRILANMNVISLAQLPSVKRNALSNVLILNALSFAVKSVISQLVLVRAPSHYKSVVTLVQVHVAKSASNSVTLFAIKRNFLRTSKE